MKKLLTLLIAIPFFIDARAQYIFHFGGNDSCGFYGDGGPIIKASIARPYSMITDHAGNLYLSTEDRIRKIAAHTGIVITCAGGGTDTVDGSPATSIRLLASRTGLSFDTSGNLLIGSTERVWRIDKTTSIAHVVAGFSATGYSADSVLAIAAHLTGVSDVKVDKHNNIYICEQTYNRIRKIDPVTGIMKTIAGAGPGGYNGDGIPAVSATIWGPTGIFIDDSDNVFIVDNGNSRIRKVTASNGSITTVAGTGTSGHAGDGGAATAASLEQPSRVNLDRSGNMYISELAAIRMVDHATGIIHTIAGTGVVITTAVLDSFGDNGPAVNARVAPGDVVFDTCNNIFMADYLCRLRIIAPGPVPHPCNFTLDAPAIEQVVRGITIYPNPSSENCEVLVSTATPLSVSVIIYDVFGRKVSEYSGSSGHPIQVSGLLPGTYYVQAHCGSDVIGSVLQVR